jgi:hypothetical protein
MPRDQEKETAMAKLSLAALVVAALTLSVPVLATQTDAGATVASTVENVVGQGWCSGPRQHTDFRCKADR